MANCYKCGKPVVSGPVLHSECLDSLLRPIPIKERLPEADKDVIIYWHEGNIMFSDMAVLLKIDSQKMFATAWNNFILADNADYWFPVPERPESV